VTEGILIIPLGVVIALVYLYSDEIFGSGTNADNQGEGQ